MMNEIEAYYDSDPLKEWMRLDRHRTEFAVTLRALAEYLQPAPATVADIGSGPGRYAIELVRQGYRVTLFDLSRASLDFAQQQAVAAGLTLPDAHQGNALQLDGLAEASFDAVLMMGPLYHLSSEADRRKVVREAMRVLKPGGRLFATFINRYAYFRDCAEKNPERLAAFPELMQQVLETGVYDGKTGFTEAYFILPDQVTPFMESVGLRTMACLGCEGLVANLESSINQLQGAEWHAWVEMNYYTAHQSILLGAAAHLLYIGEKP